MDDVWIALISAVSGILTGGFSMKIYYTKKYNLRKNYKKYNKKIRQTINGDNNKQAGGNINE